MFELIQDLLIESIKRLLSNGSVIIATGLIFIWIMAIFLILKKLIAQRILSELSNYYLVYVKKTLIKERIKYLKEEIKILEKELRED